jgi:protein ImuA
MPPRRAIFRRDPVGLERLRASVRALEAAGLGLAGAPRGAALARFGAAAVDRRLPWGGLPRGALHEVVAASAADAGAATAFTAALAGRFGLGGPASVLWCEGRRTLDAGSLYPPGLARFGIDPARLIVVRPRSDAEALWAVEEGLRGRGLAAVVGEVEALSLTESRRLQLAAAASGTPALVLLPRADLGQTSAALTRWEVMALAGDFPALRWRATLARCRGGAPFTWDLEWRDETRGLAVAAPVRDRPDLPQTARLGAAKLAG